MNPYAWRNYFYSRWFLLDVKRITNQRKITIEDSLPVFSLDVEGFRELERLVAKWGFKGIISGASYGNETINGPID